MDQNTQEKKDGSPAESLQAKSSKRTPSQHIDSPGVEVFLCPSPHTADVIPRHIGRYPDVGSAIDGAFKLGGEAGLIVIIPTALLKRP